MNNQEKAFHIANHQAMAAHCAEMGKCFAKSSDAHADIAKSLEVTDPNASASHEDIANAHKAMATSCAKAGQHHLDACDKLDSLSASGEKLDGGDLQKLLADVTQLLERGTLPNGLRGIPLSDNNRPTIVPRSGQPTPADRVDKSTVQPELQEIIFDPRQAIG